jgi:chromosomal replication initiator protein
VLAAYENPVPLVTRLVAAETGVSVEAIRSISRRTHHVRARQIVMFVLRNQWGASLPKIGRFLGRDHTTVLHGVRQVEQHPIRFEPEISRVLEAVRKGRKP